MVWYPDTWATPIWPTDTWPTDIWSTDTWPTDIWPISAWGDIWPTDKMSHFNNSFIQFNNRISSIQRAVSDGNITKMWKESKEKFGQNCLLAKCPPCTYWPNVRWPSVRWPNGRWSNVPDSYRLSTYARGTVPQPVLPGCPAVVCRMDTRPRPVPLPSDSQLVIQAAQMDICCSYTFSEFLDQMWQVYDPCYTVQRIYMWMGMISRLSM